MAQRIEFELQGSEDARALQPQYRSARWPYEVIDPLKCEFQYAAFRDAYNRITRDYDGSPHHGTLTDAELRVRWLDFYVCFREPTQPQIESFARTAAGRGPMSVMSSLSSNDKSAIYAVLAIVLLVILCL